MSSKSIFQILKSNLESNRSEAAEDTNGLKYKQANVYDAVAGKIASGGFISRTRAYASTRDTASSSSKPIPPENVLFKRHDAPVRYAESDIYFANERQSRADLPDSDLLKLVHSYVSDYYSRAVGDNSFDFKSMDETALLAFGILLEETMRDILGRNGDLVFTEGAEVGDNRPLSHNSGVSTKRQAKRRRIGD